MNKAQGSLTLAAYLSHQLSHCPMVRLLNHRGFVAPPYHSHAAGDDLNSPGGNFDDCVGNEVTVALHVEPGTVTRGAPVVISVVWEVTEPVAEPAFVTLSVAEAGVEVELPLSLDPAIVSPTTYVAETLNPFGIGAPAGLVYVLASGAQSIACQAPATAATSMVLE